jgi:hypothetical protein
LVPRFARWRPLSAGKSAVLPREPNNTILSTMRLYRELVRPLFIVYNVHVFRRGHRPTYGSFADRVNVGDDCAPVSRGAYRLRPRLSLHAELGS